MSATRTRRSTENESVPQVPQSTPSTVGYGAPSHDFTLQAVMELQKSVGELNANMQAMKGSLDSMKTKVEDLVGWKHKIIGGIAVIGFGGAILGWVLAKASDYVTVRIPASTPVVVAPAMPTPAGPTAGPASAAQASVPPRQSP